MCQCSSGSFRFHQAFPSFFLRVNNFVCVICSRLSVTRTPDNLNLFLFPLSEGPRYRESTVYFLAKSFLAKFYRLFLIHEHVSVLYLYFLLLLLIPLNLKSICILKFIVKPYKYNKLFNIYMK